MKKVLSVLIIVALFEACSTQASSPTDVVSQELGVSFELRIGRSVAISGEVLGFQFLNVPSDSRCPDGAQCIWAGNAVVELQFPDLTDSLNTIANPSEIRYGAYTVRLLDLSPYPKTGVQRDSSQYVARLVVTKG